MNRAPTDTVIAGVIAFLVLALSLFGALESLPQWVRGTAQAIGTLAGIYLGSHLQLRDQRHAAEGAAKSSILSLVALAKGVRAHLDSLEAARARLQQSPPRSIDAYYQASEAIMDGMDTHDRSVLAQAQAASEAWYPFLRPGDPFLQQLGNDSDPSEEG